MATQAIVTRDSLRTMLMNPDREYVMKVIGHALVALFQRQTVHERSANAAEVHNAQGFSGTDAKGGCLDAKTYLKTGRLQHWQMEKWLKVSDRTGYPRLCKYHRQLNEIAEAKQRVIDRAKERKGE